MNNLANKIEETLQLDNVSAHDYGSVQYNTIGQIVACLEAVGPKGLGIDFDLASIETIPMEDVLASINKELLEDYPDEDEHDQLIESPITSIEQLITFTRDSAWDLWSVILFLSSIMLPDLETKIDDSPAWGPILNQLAQSENYQLGFDLWLIETKYDLSEDWSDYDT